jgi:hypothetical protein
MLGVSVINLNWNKLHYCRVEEKADRAFEFLIGSRFVRLFTSLSLACLTAVLLIS